jgi:hypothetical protein
MIPSISAELSPSATAPAGQQTGRLLAQRVGHSRHQFVKLEPGRLRMSLLAENTMNEVYTMKEVIDRMCCLTQELAQIELLGRFSDLRYGNTNVVEQAR